MSSRGRKKNVPIEWRELVFFLPTVRKEEGRDALAGGNPIRRVSDGIVYAIGGVAIGMEPNIKRYNVPFLIFL